MKNLLEKDTLYLKKKNLFSYLHEKFHFCIALASLSVVLEIALLF
jgi:hypothetical protein